MKMCGYKPCVMLYDRHGHQFCIVMMIEVVQIVLVLDVCVQIVLLQIVND